MNDKVTAGKIATDLMQKGLEQVNPLEYQREIHKKYEQEIYTCVENGIKKYEGDFFVVVLYKRERALLNVYRAYYFPRQSCPTPSYDQIVYKYHRKDRLIELLWVMPDLETATVFQNHALEVSPEEQGLLHFVLDFYDGTLDKLAQKLNNEGVIWTN
jgi:hypothetical protein